MTRVIRAGAFCKIKSTNDVYFVIDTVERNLEAMIENLDKHQEIGSLEIDDSSKSQDI